MNVLARFHQKLPDCTKFRIDAQLHDKEQSHGLARLETSALLFIMSKDNGIVHRNSMIIFSSAVENCKQSSSLRLAAA